MHPNARPAFRLMSAIGLALMIAAMPARAQAPSSGASVEDLDRRVGELEAALKKSPPTAPAVGDEHLLLLPPTWSTTIEGQLPSVPPSSAPAAAPVPAEPVLPLPATEAETKPAITTGWDDGFILRSADKRFSLRITGQIQGDFRAFLDANDRADIDSFFIRRARFGLEATLFEFYEFRLLPDFGQGQTRLQDAYMNVHYWDAFQVQGGKFKQPFSYEQLIQDRFTPLMERSLIDQLVPARDEGLMLHGQKLFGDRFDYGVSVYNGVQNGDADTNDHKDIAARVVARPFATWEDSPLRYFQVGMAATTGVQNEFANPAVLRTPLGVPFFQFRTGVYADGLRNRWSPEVVYFYKGFGFAAQYFGMTQEFRPAFLGRGSSQVIDVPFGGYYFQATYLLTGEERTTYSAVAPLRPFDPHCGCFGPGAWELVARVSHLKVGDDVFLPATARLANPAGNSNEATELTVGFNWYLNKWVRTQFNWEHAWFGQPVRLGPGPKGLFLDHDTVAGRLQVIF
jgi:phosphate-selective porin OprO/OprP